MKQWTKYIVSGVSFVVLTGGFMSMTADDKKPRFPVSPTVPENYQDITTNRPIDLRAPQNLSDDFEYNPLTGRYEYRTQIAGFDLTTPITLTPEEYIHYSLQKSMSAYFKAKNDEDSTNPDGSKRKDAFSVFDFSMDLGPAEKLFGPGGVRLQAQGGATIKAAVSHTSTGDPTKTPRQRNRTAFDFDTQVQTSITASVGDKINFDLNYNTESTFDFDTKKIKLAYTGKEDEIIKTLEAGNVSMKTSNSLIRGGAALWGIKSELQFGKLTIGAIFSQQQSQSRTTSSRGNVQVTPFEITVDNYDENMHYFLGHYFHDTYDQAMSSLPHIKSGITIENIEVWITNKRSDYERDQVRNIVAFTDLGENDPEYFSNPDFVHARGRELIPQNNANDLYANLNNSYPGVRNISTVNQSFAGTTMQGGKDYEKIENARKLNSNEYVLNSRTGYISLRSQLQPDEVLAVAFSYRYNGDVYKVGEFSTDNPDQANENLYLKLLKGTESSPASPTWALMMKNVYTISNRSIEKEKFRLDIQYLNDTTGIYLNYITEGAIANKLLLKVENLDRLDTNNEPYPDGFFDFVESFTVLSQTGKIVFPVVEPFGSHLRKKIGNDAIADKYVYQELYDSTLTVARQMAEKNKFLLKGEYKGSGGSNIDLDGYNIARGSVIVTANGVRLTENIDYTVDYATGNITIINPAYENANIQTSSENQTVFNMQRRTMMGLNMNYAFSPKFNVGATIMNLSEMPLTLKTQPGEESINNTLFGFNMNYTTSSYLLTNLLDKLPFIELTAPSQITLTAEYANLIPGHYHSEYGGDESYIDDFERAKITLDLRSPYSWNLSSTPSDFPESRLVNDVAYGNNRALLAWYYIDGLFTRKSSLTPSHIKNDLDQLSNHYVREIPEIELFPSKDQRFNEASTLPVLNLAFYPKERGPYNVDAAGMNPDGTLARPEDRWGGIFRKIESGQTDFEASNIEHIEFWMLDPFIYEPNAPGGDLYFNLGEISEDILKDEKKFFENGLPADGDTTRVEKTVWGYVPKQQSLVYAFDNAEGARQRQDVGFNGLSTAEEFAYPTYAKYLEQLRAKLNPDVIRDWENNPLSPLRDPSGDNYHYFRGADFDRAQTPILERYKHYNGTEGNSADASNSSDNLNTSAKVSPDVEDINQDNTLNENEKYFQYRVSIRPEDLQVGKNFIVDRREAIPTLKNGKKETVNWYLFKIPIRDYEKNVNNIRDFKTVRFVRMFMTHFSDSAVLRFGTLELVRGDWRAYTKDLSNPNIPPSGDASISISTVNIEENGNKKPVNYIMPPNVNRMIDPGQPQLRMQNEQSLAVQIMNLSSGDARAVYKNIGLDTRQYRRLQMFVHADKMEETSDLQDNDLSVFLRMGSDYKNNYYEYEIPLKLTKPGVYNSNSTADRDAVWNPANKFDFPFELLTQLKLNRNREKRKESSTVNYYTPYSEFDPEKPMNKVTVMGNPSFSDVKVIMIGVRNNSRSAKSTEVWFDELRLTDFNEDGGWAGNVNLFVGLSDLGSVNFSGRKETAGFGSLDQGILDRNIDDKQSYSISGQLEMGKFFPEKAKVSMPVYLSYSEDVVSPKYNPLDQDILLKNALEAMDTQAQQDSIREFAQNKVVKKSLDISNVRVNITSKNPMPYDPANFSLGYSYTNDHLRNASTQYEIQSDARLLFNYNYSPFFKPWKPFKKDDNKPKKTDVSDDSSRPRPPTESGVRSGKAKTNFFTELGIGYLPKSISFVSTIQRTYFESQLRDLNQSSEVDRLTPSFRENFVWNRDFNLQWEPLTNLNMNLQSGTQARIDAPHVQVNKKFNSDDYTLWKDSVQRSLQDWGTPMHYAQNFSATYSLPFKDIPILNFIQASVNYTADYFWDRYTRIENIDDEDDSGEPIELGNTIRNSRTFGLSNVNMNLLNLYNKSKFLEAANKKYTFSRANNRNAAADDKKKKAQQEKLKKKFDHAVQLNPNEATEIRHSLDNKRLKITAKGPDGRVYPVRYKIVDKNMVKIENRDSIPIHVSITQLPPIEDASWYKYAQIAARGLMMVRNVSFSYTQNTGLMIPGFNQDIGDFTGQGNSATGTAPGWDFAFGLTGEDYLQKADDREWLLKNNNVQSPAMYNRTETFIANAIVEPFVGLKITLNASRNHTYRNEQYYMYANSSPTFSGDFNMTTIALGSSFERINAKNGYYSGIYEKFLENREIIAKRLDQSYSQVFNQHGQAYSDPISRNASDVVVTAFLATYTGKNPQKAGLSLFPSLKNLLPNWQASYEGLMQLPFFKKHFKSFSIEHGYKCMYQVGSFNSFPAWTALGDQVGYIPNEMTGRMLPSSPYNITAVSLTERFDPLFGIKSTFLNNTSLRLEYKMERMISLNVSSAQIVETTGKTINTGIGYRFENFNKVLKLPKTGGESFNNDLRVSADFAFTTAQSLIRRYQEPDDVPQATRGDSQLMIKMTADYTVSKMLTFQAFLDRQVSTPLISATAYPFSKTNFGISLKVSLAK
ncbi:MAG: cell surface protein SprA [Dysgonamonadaceae bacterium]|jgi:cell surface protein SprA|nr:cell surface protein SprA [Dysgonamonadaceae bacterium]